MSISPPRHAIHPKAQTRPFRRWVSYRPTPKVSIYNNGNVCVAWKATRKTSLNPIAGTRVPQHQRLGLSADHRQARYDELVTIVQYEAMGDNVPAAHERRALVNPELDARSHWTRHRAHDNRMDCVRWHAHVAALLGSVVDGEGPQKGR
jgi:hypothetical protein